MRAGRPRSKEMPTKPRIDIDKELAEARRLLDRKLGRIERALVDAIPDAVFGGGLCSLLDTLGDVRGARETLRREASGNGA